MIEVIADISECRSSYFERLLRLDGINFLSNPPNMVSGWVFTLLNPSDYPLPTDREGFLRLVERFVNKVREEVGAVPPSPRLSDSMSKSDQVVDAIRDNQTLSRRIPVPTGRVTRDAFGVYHQIMIIPDDLTLFVWPDSETAYCAQGITLAKRQPVGLFICSDLKYHADSEYILQLTRQFIVKVIEMNQ